MGTVHRKPQARGAAAARHTRSPRRSAAGGTLLGVFIGVALGLAIAAGVAFYILKGGNPYQSTGVASTSRDVAHEAPSGRAAKGDSAALRPRFDFYKILPSGEEPKLQAKAAERTTDRATVERTTPPAVDAAPDKNGPASRDSKSPDRFWLQAGSFASGEDAENLKARLALAGWEAAVQEASVPDKGVRFRVRLGPYDNTDELNRLKSELNRRGFEVAVIKY